MRFAITAGLCALLLLAACGKPKEAEKTPAPAEATAIAPAGFNHDPAFDAAGYYKPVTDIIINNFQLDHIAVGAASDFETWEKGERAEVYGPLMIEFNDITSPKTTNEMGQEVYTVRVRVMPTAYKLNATDIGFAGADQRIGKVVFEGAFDAPSYTEAHKSGSSGNQPVMIGALTMGDNTIRNQKFTFFAGD